jgi:cell division inhibitor SepF
MSKFGDKVKSFFTVDYDDYEDDYYDDYDDEIMEAEEVVEKEKPAPKKRERVAVSKPEPQPRQATRPRTSTASSTQNRFSRASRSSKVVPMRGGNDMEVCVIKPTYYESTKDIIDNLLDGKSVVLNLEGMKLDLAQRIVDSVSGGCYAISGNIQKISGYIYLVTPNTVDITGDFQDYLSDATSSASSYRSNY